VTAQIISLDEWRARSPHLPRYPDDHPEHAPPFTPALRLVASDERPGDAFRLDVFLSRARLVLAESGQDHGRTALHAVPAS
jgi:hypothetical protein